MVRPASPSAPEVRGEALSAAAKWWGGRVFEVQVRDHRFAIDSAGREGVAAMEGVLAALAACLGSMVAEILDAMHARFEGLEVRAWGSEEEDSPRVFRTVEVEVCVSRVARDKAERAVSLAESKYCPVSTMLRRAGVALHVRTVVPDEAPRVT